jgi:hypothetical protein
MNKYNFYIIIGALSLVFSAWDFFSTLSGGGQMDQLNGMISQSGMSGDIYSMLGITKLQVLIGIVLLETLPGIIFIYIGVVRKIQLGKIIRFYKDKDIIDFSLLPIKNIFSYDILINTLQEKYNMKSIKIPSLV